MLLKVTRIKTLWSSQHALKPFLATDNFKSYDELKEKLIRVIAGTRSTKTADSEELPPTATPTGKVQSMSEIPTTPAASDDDDTLSYFSKLAEDE